jgi:23S rRNA (uracil1939-C5)-methyltransferase
MSLSDLPVQIDKEYEFDIIDVSPNGEGIAKVKGYSVFINGAKPGEHVRARIRRLDSLCADAELAT